MVEKNQWESHAFGLRGILKNSAYNHQLEMCIGEFLLHFANRLNKNGLFVCFEHGNANFHLALLKTKVIGNGVFL